MNTLLPIPDRVLTAVLVDALAHYQDLHRECTRYPHVGRHAAVLDLLTTRIGQVRDCLDYLDTVHADQSPATLEHT